ncbi:hypothetical protein A6P39_035060 [Streptomyces sp. FXJ1.172]|uniref:hypothetical protein n=1 Tax=Streptomyces sp. FXJ1.172 TaxID=710705 RepID=UPI0007CFD1B7|nr:hypothetical protein [Streptomyces sp. FXJ1.172]WEO98847.1 hypothetical protein A6P39_035060 [Streptomyces sp. FXJ1.172]
MRTGSEHRDRRFVLRTAAAVAVLLVALLHLLACAHGPASPDAADSRLVSGPVVAADAHAFAADAHGDSGQGPKEHCCHADEPSVQARRGTGPAKQPGPGSGPVHEAVPVRGVLAPSGSVVRPDRPPGNRAHDSSAGRSLARLGVWRT